MVGENKKFEEIITSSWGNCDMLVVFFTTFKHFIDRTVTELVNKINCVPLFPEHFLAWLDSRDSRLRYDMTASLSLCL